MNACKLKKGFVFKNEYISNVDEIYSIDTYDFASNDFFEVKTYDDLDYARKVLNKKVIDYHKKNGVYFENTKLVSIDATTEIGYDSRISAGVSVKNHSTIFRGGKISANSSISNSKIGEDATIGKNVVIEDSVIKSGVVIESGAIVKGCVVGNNVKIGTGSKVISTGVKDGSVVGVLSQVFNSRIAENVHIGNCSIVLGDKMNSLILKNSTIASNVKIVDSKIAENSNISSNVTIINDGKVGE